MKLFLNKTKLHFRQSAFSAKLLANSFHTSTLHLVNNDKPVVSNSLLNVPRFYSTSLFFGPSVLRSFGRGKGLNQRFYSTRPLPFSVNEKGRFFFTSFSAKFSSRRYFSITSKLQIPGRNNEPVSA